MKLLCFLGFHKWEEIPQRPLFMFKWHCCKRCGGTINGLDLIAHQRRELILAVFIICLSICGPILCFILNGR